MQVYKWGFVARPSGQMVWKAFSYHMFQRGNHQLCRQMKRDEKSRIFSYHPRPTLQRQDSCGSLGTSSSISNSSSTAKSTITSVSGVGNNSNNSSSCSNSRADSSENAEPFYSHGSVIRPNCENILLHHSDVLDINEPSSSGNYNLINFFNSEDMKELLCILEDLD
jgi:hypothetical protein